MRKCLILLWLVLLTTPACAGISVCYNGTAVTSFALSSGPQAGCIYYNDSDLAEYERVKTLLKTVSQKYLKIDLGTVYEMSQAEKDAVDAAEQVAANTAANATVDNLEVTSKDIWVAFIQVYNSKMPVQYRITAQEIKDQIKINLGITP